MDKNKDAKLVYDEFVDGCKLDPTILKVRPSPHFEILSSDAIFLGSNPR